MEYREKYRSIVLMSTSRILYFHKLLISESDVTHVLPQVVRITKYLFINSKIATDVLSIAVQVLLRTHYIITKLLMIIGFYTLLFTIRFHYVFNKFLHGHGIH